MLAVRAGAQRFHAQPLSPRDELKDKLLASLPFKPTGAQARVTAEIERDMALDVPMMRLVQGMWGPVKRWLQPWLPCAQLPMAGRWR